MKKRFYAYFNNQSPKWVSKLALLTAILLVSVVESRGQVWQSSSSTAWNTSANWSPTRSGASGSNTWLTTDNAQFNATGTATVGINFGTGASGGDLLYQ